LWECNNMGKDCDLVVNILLVSTGYCAINVFLNVP